MNALIYSVFSDSARTLMAVGNLCSRQLTAHTINPTYGKVGFIFWKRRDAEMAKEASTERKNKIEDVVKYQKLIAATRDIFAFGSSDAVVCDRRFSELLDSIGERSSCWKSNGTLFGINYWRLATPHGVFIVPEIGKEKEFVCKWIKGGNIPKIIHSNNFCPQRYGLDEFTYQSPGWNSGYTENNQ